VTSGCGSGIVGYNVQVAVDTEHHPIVTQKQNMHSDRAQLAHIAKEAQAVLQTDVPEAVADRGHYDGKAIPACEEAGIRGRLRTLQPAFSHDPPAFRRSTFNNIPG